MFILFLSQLTLPDLTYLLLLVQISSVLRILLLSQCRTGGVSDLQNMSVCVMRSTLMNKHLWSRCRQLKIPVLHLTNPPLTEKCSSLSLLCNPCHDLYNLQPSHPTPVLSHLQLPRAVCCLRCIQYPLYALNWQNAHRKDFTSPEACSAVNDALGYIYY